MMKNNSLIILTILIIFLVLENFFPLRKRRDHVKRILHNFSLAGLALPFTRLMTLPLVLYLASTAELKGWGILNYFKFNNTVPNIFGIIVMDYALYWWHLANHKIGFFWRFHQVHHADRDMDTTTALRFHFGELILSALMRCTLILIIGIKVETIIIFDVLVTCFTLFHHSNLKLPLWLEKFLALIIVTPLYHQNHHSYYLEETNSNYSTIFSFWDRVHLSFTIANKPDDIIIGHPSLSSSELKFMELIKMPFKAIRKWPDNLLSRRPNQKNFGI
ncbi:MAG: sterol desaturase family protein [Bacteriovorax sp.]|nr:sterol desaturase family protein [Bacteriovorax sp.]